MFNASNSRSLTPHSSNIHSPISASHKLGTPLPCQEHACSVSMPTWEDVIQYEEGNPRVHRALKCGYPRFVYHPSVRKLNAYVEMKLSTGPEKALVFPCKEAAERCREFILRNSHVPVRIVPLHVADAAAILTSEESLSLCKLYWQHSGEILSSRHAEFILTQLEQSSEGSSMTSRSRQLAENLNEQLADRLGQLYAQPSSSITLFPSGMAAIFTAYRMLRRYRPQAKTVVFGFPYLDTLKLLQRPEFGPGVHFFPRGDVKDFEALELLIQKENVAGIFVEFPSNPLLTCIDLQRLSCIAKAHGCLLVIDDTICGPCNLDLLTPNIPDIIASSLTKVFSGQGNVMGGCLVVNSSGRFATALQSILSEIYQNMLYIEDIAVLLANSRDLEERCAKINQTAVCIVEKLKAHFMVKDVFYPSNPENVNQYIKFMARRVSQVAENNESKSDPGYGGLISIVLRGGRSVAAAFYDSLGVSKGPSLGTNFTLCCPYTILAHYYELDFAAHCGVSEMLIRLWIGLESCERVWASIENALCVAHKVWDEGELKQGETTSTPLPVPTK